jgi:formylglycine-generating enzyme required for sulfatase activity
VGFETLRFDDKPSDLLPIGALPPNPWGFHDIVGNIAEMCGDVGADIEDELLTEWVQLVPPLPGDGLKAIALDTYRLALGGAYWMRPRAALVEMELDPGERDSGSGLRLAMRVLP